MGFDQGDQEVVSLVTAAVGIGTLSFFPTGVIGGFLGGNPRGDDENQHRCEGGGASCRSAGPIPEDCRFIR